MDNHDIDLLERLHHAVIITLRKELQDKKAPVKATPLPLKQQSTPLLGKQSQLHNKALVLKFLSKTPKTRSDLNPRFSKSINAEELFKILSDLEMEGLVQKIQLPSKCGYSQTKPAWRLAEQNCKEKNHRQRKDFKSIILEQLAIGPKIYSQIRCHIPARTDKFSLADTLRALEASGEISREKHFNKGSSKPTIVWHLSKEKKKATKPNKATTHFKTYTLGA